MTAGTAPLVGRRVRLEPLDFSHVPALVSAAAADPSLYRWTNVPQGEPETREYVRFALDARDAGTAEPFATIRLSDGAVVGSTRLWELERWPWPPDHPRSGRSSPDVGEIGYTWLAASAIRSGINTEAKLLLLQHAFDDLGLVRVCLHTDARNERSRRAIEGIGGRFEGILRAHRLATDNTVRDSARFSIVAAEWPQARAALIARAGE